VACSISEYSGKECYMCSWPVARSQSRRGAATTGSSVTHAATPLLICTAPARGAGMMSACAAAKLGDRRPDRHASCTKLPSYSAIIAKLLLTARQCSSKYFTNHIHDDCLWVSWLVFVCLNSSEGYALEVSIMQVPEYKTAKALCLVQTLQHAMTTRTNCSFITPLCVLCNLLALLAG